MYYLIKDKKISLYLTLFMYIVLAGIAGFFLVVLISNNSYLVISLFLLCILFSNLCAKAFISYFLKK